MGPRDVGTEPGGRPNHGHDGGIEGRVRQHQVAFTTLAAGNVSVQWTGPLSDGISDIINGLEGHGNPLFQQGYDQIKTVLAEVLP